MVFYWNAAPAKPVAGKGKGKGKGKKAAPVEASPSGKSSGSQRKGPTTRRRA